MSHEIETISQFFIDFHSDDLLNYEADLLEDDILDDNEDELLLSDDGESLFWIVLIFNAIRFELCCL